MAARYSYAGIMLMLLHQILLSYIGGDVIEDKSDYIMETRHLYLHVDIIIVKCNCNVPIYCEKVKIDLFFLTDYLHSNVD